MALEPINTNTILTTSDPVPTTDISVQGWVVTETMEISFGDYTGRPDVEHVQLAREMLAYFFEQGWFIVAVISASSDGKWESVATNQVTLSRDKSFDGTTTTNETGTANSQTVDQTETPASNSYQSSYTVNSDGQGGGSGWASGTTSANGGKTVANGVSNSVEDGKKTESSTEKEDGSNTESRTESDAYWSSWQKVRLQRKRIHPRKVLESMVGELVTSYKSGEKAISDRYTAVVSLYSTMLSKTEGEVDSLADEVTSFKTLMSGVMDALSETLSSISTRGTDDKINEAAEYQRRTINEKFDALVAGEKGKLITAGLFNSTQWTMISAGIERERGIALLAVSDKILGWKRDLAATAAALAAPMEQAARSMWEAGAEGSVKPTQMRNEVLKWMLDYCERHSTERAKIQDIAQVPKVLDGMAYGYAEK